MNEANDKKIDVKRVRIQTVLVTVLVLGVLLGAGYFVYDQFFRPEEVKKKASEKVEKKPVEKKETYVSKADESKPYIYIAEDYVIPGAFTPTDSIQTAFVNIKDNEAITKLNSELKQYSELLKQSVKKETYTTGEIVMDRYVKSMTNIIISQNYASMVITSPTAAQGDELPIDIKTYTIDLKTGAILSEDDLLTRYGIAKDQFFTFVKSKLPTTEYLCYDETDLNAYMNKPKGPNGDTVKAFYYNKNILPSLLYVNERETLSLMIKVRTGFFSNDESISIEL